MTLPPFVVVGEALVDIVNPVAGPVRQSPGGSPLNVAVGLSRLDVPTLLLTELGDDEHGRAVADHVHASGVLLHEASVVPGSPTSTATATLDESGAATYSFDLHWTLEHDELPEARALHVGSLGASLRPGREAVLRLLDGAVGRGIPVSFDPNARPALTPDAAQAWRDAKEVAARADLVKMSDEDLAFLRPDADARTVADELLAAGTRVVVLTHGGGGAVGYTSDGAVEVSSRRTPVADTVGAGDSFMAALLAVSVAHEHPEQQLEAWLSAAHQAAAVTVSRPGADPPWRRELPEGWPGLA